MLSELRSALADLELITTGVLPPMPLEDVHNLFELQLFAMHSAEEILQQAIVQVQAMVTSHQEPLLEQLKQLSDNILGLVRRSTGNDEPQLPRHVDDELQQLRHRAETVRFMLDDLFQISSRLQKNEHKLKAYDIQMDWTQAHEAIILNHVCEYFRVPFSVLKI